MSFFFWQGYDVLFLCVLFFWGVLQFHWCVRWMPPGEPAATWKQTRSVQLSHAVCFKEPIERQIPGEFLESALQAFGAMSQWVKQKTHRSFWSIFPFANRLFGIPVFDPCTQGWVISLQGATILPGLLPVPIRSALSRRSRRNPRRRWDRARWGPRMGVQRMRRSLMKTRQNFLSNALGELRAL